MTAPSARVRTIVGLSVGPAAILIAGALVFQGSQAASANPVATAASTALPPARSTSAPASAVSGWPAATTPLIGASLAAGRPLGQPRGTNSGTSTSASMFDGSRERRTCGSASAGMLRGDSRRVGRSP